MTVLKFLNSTSSHLQVQHHGGGAYYNTGAPSAGMLRYHNNDMQVYDGSNWLSISSSASVGLSTDAEAVIAWAKQKMTEEMRIKDLMERHPGLKDAYEKFEIMKILVSEEEQNRV